MKLAVSTIKNIDGQVSLPYSDSLKIEFDGGFDNDIIKIATGNMVFTTKVLNTDLRIGYAGTLIVPKIKRRQRIFIYRNDNFVGQLILKKKFSAVHVNCGDRKMTWVYIDYQFIYL